MTRKMLSVEINQARPVIAPAPDTSSTIPTDVHSVRPRTVLWDFKVSYHDVRFGHLVDRTGAELRDAFRTRVALIGRNARKQFGLGCSGQ